MGLAELKLYRCMLPRAVLREETLLTHTQAVKHGLIASVLLAECIYDMCNQTLRCPRQRDNTKTTDRLLYKTYQ